MRGQSFALQGRKIMSMPQRFGDAEPAEASFDKIYRALQVAQVAGRDVNGFYAVARAKNPADRLVAKAEKRRRTPLKADLIVLAAKEFFGAADGRNAQAQPEMRSESEFPGVSDALPVTQKDVGRAKEFSVGFEQRGHFAKREQPGNVGERNGRNDAGILQRAEIRPLESRHYRNQLIGRRQVSNIRRSQNIKFMRNRLQFHPSRKVDLQSLRSRRRQVPSVVFLH